MENINESQIDTTLTLESTTLKNPPCITKQPTVFLNLAKHLKINTSPSTFLEKKKKKERYFIGTPKL